jgi:hypothetical protein
MSGKCKSNGPSGNLDSRRWVIMTVRNNGANEAQFPLPVTVNTQRIAFDRDEAVVTPAYYLDTLDNCILPKYEKIPAGARTHDGSSVQNEDDARMVEIKYSVDTEEIPKKYQTVDGIIQYVKMVNSEECPPELEGFKNRLRLGQMSFNKLNYDWSKLNEPKKKVSEPAKKEVKKVATTNT